MHIWMGRTGELAYSNQWLLCFFYITASLARNDWTRDSTCIRIGLGMATVLAGIFCFLFLDFVFFKGKQFREGRRESGPRFRLMVRYICRQGTNMSTVACKLLPIRPSGISKHNSVVLSATPAQLLYTYTASPFILFTSYCP